MENTILKEKLWILNEPCNANSAHAIAKIARKLNIHPIIAKLLYSRGYTDEASVRTFVRMESEMLCNPFQMKDMVRGIERIQKAIEQKEKITVYGDYDVDGVTSVCTLYLYLKSKGAIIDYHIPNRAGEGYGVSRAAIDQIKESGCSLIVTVDTGVTANAEVDYAKEVGIDFVITDHHECHSDLPGAVAIINPHRPDCQYPFKELAGVGVVFKLICAYEERVCRKNRRDAALKIFSEYADLVAIGTIADVMPIKSENRIIVSYGLKMIENTERPGLIALIEASSAKDGQRNERRKKRTKITSGFIGYTLAPRINAAGRIKSAGIAVEMFLAQNLDKARKISEELCLANKERQNEENKIMKEAYELLEKMNVDDSPVIVLDADTWHHGVIGIVSSRLTEKYSKPSILVSFEGNESDTPTPDDIGKGSGRSIKGLNLVDALCYCSEHLTKFGGHELAAGLSVKRSELDNFRNKINEYARLNLRKEDMVPTVEADCEIKFSDINIYLAEQLQQLEPYGVGNPVPAFVTRDLWVNEISSVSDGKHTKLVLSDGTSSVTAMYFSNSPESLGIYSGDKIDIMFNLDINEWLGRKNVQLIIKDIKLVSGVLVTENYSKARYDEIIHGAAFDIDENVLPSRDDFAAVYKYVLASTRAGVDVFTHRELAINVSKSADNINIGYIKLKVIIRVLQELNLMGIDEYEEEKYRFSIHYTQKTNLDKSNILRKLKNQLKRA